MVSKRTSPSTSRSSSRRSASTSMPASGMRGSYHGRLRFSACAGLAVTFCRFPDRPIRRSACSARWPSQRSTIGVPTSPTLDMPCSLVSSVSSRRRDRSSSFRRRAAGPGKRPWSTRYRPAIGCWDSTSVSSQRTGWKWRVVSGWTSRSWLATGVTASIRTRSRRGSGTIATLGFAPCSSCTTKRQPA